MRHFTLPVLLILSACSQTEKVGSIPASQRTSPLTPSTRTRLEAKGAVCTPNEGGPVLCTWSGGGASCQITYDTADQLTRLSCDVDGLGYTCVRPGGGYECHWTDDPSCREIYDSDGVFVDYRCDGTSVDAGVESWDGGDHGLDGGGIWVGDAGINPDAFVDVWDTGARAMFSCTPAMVDFGVVPVGLAASASISCANAGVSPVTVTSAWVTPAGSLLIDAVPSIAATLQPGETLQLTISYVRTREENPGLPSWMVGEVGLSTDDPANPNVFIPVYVSAGSVDAGT